MTRPFPISARKAPDGVAARGPSRRGLGARGLGLRLVAGAMAALTAAAPLQASALSLVRDSEVERTLRRLIEPIFDAANVPSERVRLFIVNDNSLNAFVNAGSNMFFHTGLLRQLETPEELIGVMAHETGHITSGHFVQRIEAVQNAQSASIFAALIGIGAAAAGGGQAAASVGSSGASFLQRDLARFTRSQEAGADLEALKFMNKAGVDPEGMLRVLKRLADQQAIYLSSAVDPYVLSHPLSTERIRSLAEGVRTSPARGREVSEDLRYWHQRMRAKLDGFLSSPGAPIRESYGSAELDLYREAIALHRAPLPDEAISAVERLIAMRPKDPFYWELKGQILFESGRGPEAVAPYEKALKLAPEEPLIAAAYGEALLTLNKADADRTALRVLEKAAIADPYDAGIRRPLAAAYARTGQDGMAAVVTAERLAMLGRLPDAHRQAQRAKASLPAGSPGWLRAEDVLSLKRR